MVVFAPTFRAHRINATRTAILGPARLASGGLDAARLTDRVRAGWRGRRRERSRRDPPGPTMLRSALRDLRHGRPLGGTVRSRHEHLGAFHATNSPYEDLDRVFAGVAVGPGGHDRRRRLRQGPVAQLADRPLPGNAIYGIELDPELCAATAKRLRRVPTSRWSAVTPPS